MPDVQVIHADSRVALDAMEPDSFAAVVTDPPYALTSIVQRFGGEDPANVDRRDSYGRFNAGFMGQVWDTGETAFSAEFWRKVARVTRPGGHMIAFSHERTYDQLAQAIRAAGWEVRGMLLWIYGTGFPKSKDVAHAFETRLCVRLETAATDDGEAVVGWCYADSGEPIRRAPPYRHPLANEWAGWGTALKPAFEPMVLARKPLSESTVAANVARWGTGGLNVERCRIEARGRPNIAKRHGVPDTEGHAVYGAGISGGSKAEGLTDRGRWPANIVTDGSPEVVAAFPATAGASERKDKAAPKRGGVLGDFGGGPDRPGGYADDGSAARFFYSAKATADDRVGSEHPTVKPVDLMRWCSRLICPPGGAILDPFAGSGTTAMAALREGFDVTVVEREARYHADILAKVRHVTGADTPLFGGA